ncbi:MAG: ATP-binding protein [Anaerolineales bacterium]
MNILYEAIRLITQPPGDLVYFLITFFALQQALFSAISARRADASSVRARRWWGAILIILGGRIALIVVGLLGQGAFLDPAMILPPLERWLTSLSLALAAGAALAPLSPPNWQRILFWSVIALSLIFYGYCAATWPAEAAVPRAYNETIQEQVWTIFNFVLAGMFLVLTLILRPAEWEWLAGLWLFWMLGDVAQFVDPNLQTHFSGWQRLSALVVYPLLSILVHRQLLAGEAPAGSAQITDVDYLQEILHGIESTSEPEPALMIASSKFAKLLDVDMCAIALEAENAREGEPPHVQVIAVHPPTTAQMETPELTLDAYPALHQAYKTHQAQVVHKPRQAPWVSKLYERLGFENVGPLSALPMYRNEEWVGMLLLGNPESHRPLQLHAIATHRLVAMLLATSIVRGRSENKRKLLLNRLREQESEQQALTEQRVLELEAKIEGLEGQLAARDRKVSQLRRQVDEMSRQPSSTEIDVWQMEVKSLAEERQNLQAEIHKMTTNRDKLQRETQELVYDRDMLMDDRNRMASQLSETKARLEQEEEQRRKLQDRLKDAQRTLKSMYSKLKAAQEAAQDNMAVGLIVADEEGRIMTADALARRMLQLPEGDVTGHPINGIYPSAEWAKSIGELLSDEVNSHRRDHLTLTALEDRVEADLVTLVGHDGKPDGLVITLRMPENEIEREEAIISLANEFRTPMTALIGYTDLLMGEQLGILTKMQKDFLERVKANVEQLNHLLNDLVHLASPASRAMKLSPQPVNLIEIIEEGVMGLSARFRERRLTVNLDLPDELSSVLADRDSLYQIMLRLLSNAALCSQPQTEVKITAREETSTGAENYIRVSVTDTGGGIDPEDYPRVFRKFYRANQPLVAGMGETGVGMAVAKTLVEANGGRIWVASEPGGGSTFSFVIPVHQE